MTPELAAKVRGIMAGRRCSFRQACAELARHSAARRKARKIERAKSADTYQQLERRNLA